MFDFKKIKKIHFLGVGGVSMSSLARFFHAKNYSVTGSDRSYSSVLIDLSEEGISVWEGFEPTRIGVPDLAVYSSALQESDAELQYLRANGVPVLERHAFLPYLSSFFPYTIAIAGTHGKTTVTSMCAVIFAEAQKKFYAHIGGQCKNLGAFYYSGDDCLLIEACEYRRSMLSLAPSIGAVLNAEVDHPDTYRDKSDVFDAFDDFLTTVTGLCVVNSDSEYFALRRAHFADITYGFSPSAVYRGIDVKKNEKWCFGFRVLRFGTPFTEIQLSVPGEMNVTNALAAIAVCATFGIDEKSIREGLKKFEGVVRRFEKRGRVHSSELYCDYAHHPTEIQEGIRTARMISSGKLTVVFQPHTYSRTARLKKEFIKVLSVADRLIIVKEYAAREQPSDGCSALALFRDCPNREKYYAENLISAASLLLQKCTEDNGFILVLGAGDVVQICDLVE